MKCVVTQEIREDATEIVGARLGLRADDAGRCTELRVVVGRRDLGLGQRLEGGIDDDESEQRVVIVRAVEQV